MTISWMSCCVLSRRAFARISRMLRPARVVDEDFAFGQLRGGGGQIREIALREEAVADALEIDAGAGAKQPLDELLAAHFQAEDRDRLLVIHRDVLGDVHRQRGLAHAGPRGDDDHLRAVQAVGHLVQFRNSRSAGR